MIISIQRYSRDTGITVRLRGLVQRLLAAALLVGCFALPAGAENFLRWDTNRNRIDASVQSWPLQKLLEEITANTGWEVYVDPEARHTVSARFEDLATGDALRLLLGRINFAVVPQTNETPRLYVFLKSMGDATHLVSAPADDDRERQARRVPNELIVMLKPGSNVDIEQWAELLGAKITGRIDELGVYRLEFEDEAATEAARERLANNDNVQSVEDNYYMDRLPGVQPVLASGVSPIRLTPNAITDGSKRIIVMIDTAVQPLGKDLDSFLLEAIRVAGESNPDPNHPTHFTTMAETLLRSLSVAAEGKTSWSILPVDVYGNNIYANMFDVAKGIYLGVNEGGTIVSMALGSAGTSSVLQSVIQSAHEQGVVFLAAAGNQPVSSPTFPAAYPEVIAVTAGKSNGELASYANTGGFVDIVAPGNSIVSFNGRTYYVSGTSVSTSFAAGILAGTADKTGMPLSSVENLVRQDLAYKGAKSN